MQSRPTFDDVALREEMRQRLNAVPGVDLPAVKPAIGRASRWRCSSTSKSQERLLGALAWFREVATTVRGEA